LKKNKKERRHAIDTLQKSIQKLEGEIERHKQFDCIDAEIALNDICKNIIELESEYQLLLHRKIKCDKRQESVLNVLRKNEQELADVEERLSKAERYERKLSNASNSYGRAMIHQEAEREIGNSKPQIIIRECQSRKKTLKNTIEKLEDRLRKIGDIFSVDIQTFVIDGSNLLYNDRQFIGTAILHALIPKLLEEGYKVIVVFDANPRLRKDISKLRNRFKKDVEIREAPSKVEADRIVLNVADANSTYVISNDNFRDFPDKKCVAERRIFKHVITSGTIQIPDIDIMASFNES